MLTYKIFENIVLKAKKFAKQAHQGQYRKVLNKKGEKLDYFIHPEAVAKIVQKLKESDKIAELVSAAYLHDVVQDTDITIEEIEKEFGELVASLVNELTSDAEQIKIQGKEKYLNDKLLSMSSWGLVIKLADRLHNVNDIPYLLINGSEKEKEWCKRYIFQTKIILTNLEKYRILSNTQKVIVDKIKNKININPLNELVIATPGEYYDVLNNMFVETPELLQAIKHFDSTFPIDSKTIYKTDDDSLFIQYAEVEKEIYFGPGLYILGMASKTKKMNRKSIQDMYEILEMFKDMIYPGLNIFASVNSNTEPLIKRLTNIIKEKGLTSNQQILGQHDFGSEPEEQYKTYGISVNESLNFNERDYFFNTNEWDYKVSVKENESNPNYPWIGFKAKKTNEVDFCYDMDVITNDNIYFVINKVIESISEDINENENVGYSFSTKVNKKGNQRVNFYKKIFENKGWKVLDNEYSNHFILEPSTIESLAGMYDDVETAIKNNKKIKSKKEFDSLRKYMKYMKTFENFNETYTMYHGTSVEDEKRLIENGFEPHGSCSGGQCGNPAYLYLSQSPESANWYACQKGNDGSVIEIKDIPKSYLGVDPEDGMYLNDLDKELESGGSFILKNKLDKSHFNYWDGKLSVTGCDDDY